VSFANLLVERDGHVAVVTVNRPAKLNALDNATFAELMQCFTELGSDAAVGAVILTGAGEKAFIAGADIEMLSKQGVLDGKANAKVGQCFTELLESLPKPVIAAVNGFALGGGLEMALACDVRLASKTAKLGLPEVSLGILPGYGGTQRLPRLVGTGVAMQMILTGDMVTAEEALRVGLVNAVHEPAELMAAAKAMAQKMVSRGPLALAHAKQAVRRGLQMPLADALALEADLFGMMSATDEMKEGMAAFLQKRKPTWLRQ